MRQIIPFKKNIVLKNKFDTISSLSLEHDYKVTLDEVTGEFIVSGTYRTTQASLIDEDFYEKLPFEISLSERIIPDTVELKIEDFTYEKTNDDTVTLNIELLLNCDEEENKLEETKEERLERILETIELDNEEERVALVTEESVVQEEEVEAKPEERHHKEEMIPVVTNNNDVEFENALVKTIGITKDEALSAESLSSFVSDKKNYVTYKVYIAHEFDDFNSIATKFNVSLKDLEEYNEIKDLQVGDKVIVPYVFE